jgi:hypothetical protein
VPLNRTFLFAPGSHPRRVEKALALFETLREIRAKDG